MVISNTNCVTSGDTIRKEKLIWIKMVLNLDIAPLMIFERHANLKYKYGNRHFWAEGYYVSTVGLNEATIKKYIQEQEKHDIALDKLSVKEYEDPFKGC